jgi:hypothetical protein
MAWPILTRSFQSTDWNVQNRLSEFTHCGRNPEPRSGRNSLCLVDSWDAAGAKAFSYKVLLVHAVRARNGGLGQAHDLGVSRIEQILRRPQEYFT